MSWGIKITTLYLGFVTIILALVFTCFNHKTELVSKDYYAKELKFQNQIDAQSNANNLSVAINYMVDNRSVKIILPKEVLSPSLNGTVYFLRSNDATQDKTIPLMTDEDGVQIINPGFIKGIYKMHISFTSQGKSYFKEAVVNFN